LARHQRPAAAHQELELKAVVLDPQRLRDQLRIAGATQTFHGEMHDHRYDRGDELTAADHVLRTRLMISHTGVSRTILGWKGPVRIAEGRYKEREEMEFGIEGGNDPAPLLRALGYVQIYAIDREVEIYDCLGAVVRLERYPLMDWLVEVEGEPEAIERAILVSGIDRDLFVSDSLADFVRRYEARTGQQAKVSGDLS
jgi:adenylate cyclase class IV